MLAEEPGDRVAHGRELVNVARGGLVAAPRGRIHPRRLAALVEPAGAAPPPLHIEGLRHRGRRRTRRLQPAAQLLGQVVGQSGDLDAAGHLPRALHDVHDHPRGRGVALDRGRRLGGGKALPLERQRRVLRDRGEKGLAGGQRPAEQQEIVVGLERPGELHGVEVGEPADDIPPAGRRLLRSQAPAAGHEHHAQQEAAGR